jgi:ribulose-5-phosphate 4-epimerase/fuculose-1-phosphate aldolase
MSEVTLLQSRAVTHEEIEASEWQARVDLAAFYRLAALYGWDDLLATHISARVPGADHHFLINPYGLRFSEITASSLVKIDLDGNKVAPSEYGINYAGFVIHSAIHAAREDAHWIVHFHTDDGVAVSSQKDGLLPLNQRSLGVLPRLTYHDYEGIALRLDERERLVTDLGPTSSLMLLRNHGTLALGPTAGAAWLGIYQLERACTAQIRALSAGRDGVLIAPEAAQREVAGLHSGDPARRAAHADLVWKALLRQVQKEAPGHDI